MAARIIALSTGYSRAFQRLGLSGTVRGQRTARTILSMEAAVLPGPQDIEAPVPPTGRAYVRRVAGENLWVWYRATDDTLRVLALTDNPPVPI